MQRLRKLSNITLGRLKPVNILYGKSHLTSVLESATMHVFFLVDTSYCKTEDDDPKDAIIYFYPPQVPESQLCALCCQMTGAVQFFRNTFSCPKIIHLSRGKFAVKFVNSYFFCLGSSSDMPDKKLGDSLEFLYDLFTFYHHSIESVKDLCLRTGEEFKTRIQIIWKFLIESACTDEKVSWVAEIIPRVQDLLPSVYLSAFHILQSCQRLPHVLGGCIIYNKSIVCTQLSPKTSAYLCHFQEDLLHASNRDESNNYMFSSVYLTLKDISKTSSMNAFSKVFKKQWHITDFSTEASMSCESHEPEPSEVDSSFEDSVKMGSQASQGFTQTLPNYTSVDSCKTKSDVSSTWLPNCISSAVQLNFQNESSDATSLTSKPQPLKFKSNSLSVLQSVAEESLKRLKLYEDSERPRHRRKKNKKTEKDVLFLSDGHERKSDVTVDEAIHSENSVDSSFFEPKPLLESQKSDTSHKSEMSLSTNNYGSSQGNTSPVFLGLYQEVNEIRTPTKTKCARALDFSEASDTTFQSLGLCCVKFAKTLCFVVTESDKNDDKAAISKICSQGVKQLNSYLCKRKDTEQPYTKPVSAVYCDHFWNSTVGDKLPKTNHQLNDLQDHPSFKSITVMNMTGVAYTHSSISHKIYVENSSVGSSVAGIPSPQDVMARISHLPKQKHDRMGYFLLK